MNTNMTFAPIFFDYYSMAGKPGFRSWISCPCIYCNVIDEDKIILAAQFALEQAKKEITTRRAKCAKKY